MVVAEHRSSRNAVITVTVHTLYSPTPFLLNETISRDGMTMSAKGSRYPSLRRAPYCHVGESSKRRR